MNRKRSIDISWERIFAELNLAEFDFAKSVFTITNQQIKQAAGGEAVIEPRILCYQTTRESRPDIFIERGLFVLPVSNGKYAILKGEGYVDIPPITTPPIKYSGVIDYALDTVNIGDSEMQTLDYAYAISMMRSFMKDDSLVLTIRGRKYTPEFSFKVGKFEITASGVQTEVDGGYEGRDSVVLVEAKMKTANTIIRQMYYPYRQWSQTTNKNISVVFFEKHDENLYSFWEFVFDDPNDYNSIRLARSANYTVA